MTLTATKVKPVYDGAGSFQGFSAFIGGDWSAARTYKELMRSIADSGSDILYAQKKLRKWTAEFNTDPNIGVFLSERRFQVERRAQR